MSRVPLQELLDLSDSGIWGGEDAENGVSVLRSTNFKANGTLDYTKLTFRVIEERKRAAKILQEGDILLEKSGGGPQQPVGRVCLYRGHSLQHSFGNFIARLRPKPIILSEFLFYFLWQFHATGKTSHYQKQTTGIRNLEFKRFLTIDVPVPPLPEQRRIVDLLSRAEGIVRLRREAEKKAAELIPALFLDLFGDPATNPKGWPAPTLGELLLDGPQNGLYKHASHYGDGTPILRIDAFYDGQVRDLKSLKRVALTPDECTRFRLRPRDLVINRVNSPEYLGKSTIIPSLDEETVFESNMMRLSVEEARVLPEYVIEHLQTSYAKAHFLSKAKHAINQSSINQQDVKSLRVTMPPLLMQHDFVDKVGQVRSIQSQQSAATAKAQATFDALLARCFSQPNAA
jgi:type I restriction enzyme S subunit